MFSWKEYCDERYIKFVYLLLKVTHTVALVISHNIVNKLLIIAASFKTIYMLTNILHVKAFLIRFLVYVPFFIRVIWNIHRNECLWKLMSLSSLEEKSKYKYIDLENLACTFICWCVLKSIHFSLRSEIT